MSRIGKLPIPVPEKVNVTISEGEVSVKGPKGELSAAIPAGVKVAQEGGTVTVTRNDDSRESRGAHGLARTVVANMVDGVSTGYTRTLLINGVGYKAELRGSRWILFSLGYSHPILYELPEGVTAEIDAKAKEPKVTLSSAHKQSLGAVAADIRRLRPPEPYKGKGIRYSDETIRRKEGKAAGK
jgi:large subunit ribosomal protein L6